MPRTHSHGLRCTSSKVTYSGVRTSECGGAGGTIPRSRRACRWTAKSMARRAELRPGRAEQRAPRHPTVVDDAIGDLLVVVLEERPQPLAFRRPRDVVPQHARPVPGDELTDLGLGVVGIVTAGHGVEHLGQRSHRPVVERRVEATGVVDPEAHPRAADGLAQLADDVAATAPAGAVRIRDVRGPQAVAVHVLGDEHDVARAGRGEPRRPLVRVPLLETGFPVRGELLVRPVAVRLAVMARDRAVGKLQRVLVPLGVRRVGERVTTTGLHHLADVDVDRRERRHRRGHPVHEDPELRVLPPRGHPVPSQGPQPRPRRRS